MVIGARRVERVASLADQINGAGGKAQIAAWPRKRLTEISALDDMMLFFASDASRQVTGTFISVDDRQSL